MDESITYIKKDEIYRNKEDEHEKYLLGKYREFIEKDFIDPNKIYLNDNIFFKYYANELKQLLQETSHFQNETYRYVLGLYYYSIEDYNSMINIYNSIEQNPYVYAQLGRYYYGIYTELKIQYETYIKDAEKSGKKVNQAYCENITQKLNEIFPNILHYYGLAVELKSTYGMRLIGLYYMNQNEYEKGKYYLNMAVNQNDVESMYFLGEQYRYYGNDTIWQEYILMTLRYTNRFQDRLLQYYLVNRNYNQFIKICKISIAMNTIYSVSAKALLQYYLYFLKK